MRLPTTSLDDFVIRGGDEAFATRQKRMFDQLSQAAKEFNKDESQSSLNQREMEILRGRVAKVRNSFGKQYRKETTQYRGKESIFKRPEGPAPLAVRKSIPDHHRNPHKWVKYSLENVQSEQMSDHSNAQAAFSFLRELRARKAREHRKQDQNMNDMDVDNSDQEYRLLASNRCKSVAHIPFRKTEIKTRTDGPIVVEHDDRPIFRNSKIILPEYVVGQKQQKKPKRVGRVIKVDRSKQLKLDHLEQLDE